MEITREKVFTDLVCVTNIGKVTPEEELKLAESLGKVQKPVNERQLELHKQFKGELPGIVHVTEGGLFGHKKLLDWQKREVKKMKKLPGFDNHILVENYKLSD